MLSTGEILLRARQIGVAIPAFNIPYLPMMQPVVQAVVDQDTFSLIETARLEWVKFESVGPRAVAEEYNKYVQTDQTRRHVRLHLDHVPVIDEDGQRLDYLPIFREALSLGYGSVMLDGSRLPLEANIQATRQVVELVGEFCRTTYANPIPVEAELGAVLGHEAQEVPPYEELFASGMGFTAIDDARRFVEDSGCDWLSVAVGNIHGAVAAGRKDQKKVEARLDLERVAQLYQAAQVPLVLHGGSGIQQAYVLDAMQRGIAKINVGTEIRQPYESVLKASGSVAKAQEAVYERTCWVLKDFLQISGMCTRLAGAE